MRASDIVRFALAAVLMAMTASCGGKYVGDELFPVHSEAFVSIDSDRSVYVEIEGEYCIYDLTGGRFFEGMTTADMMANDLTAKLKADKRFKRVDYLGDRKFDIECEAGGMIGSEYLHIMNTVEVRPLGDYSVRVSSIPAGDWDFLLRMFEENSDKDRRKLSGDELKEYERRLSHVRREFELMRENAAETDIHLTVETDAEVIEHNAESEPCFFGWFGGYEWHVTSPDDPVPYILLRLDTAVPPENTGTDRGNYFSNITGANEIPGWRRISGN